MGLCGPLPGSQLVGGGAGASRGKSKNMNGQDKWLRESCDGWISFTWWQFLKTQFVCMQWIRKLILLVYKLFRYIPSLPTKRLSENNEAVFIHLKLAVWMPMAYTFTSELLLKMGKILICTYK